MRCLSLKGALPAPLAAASMLILLAGCAGGPPVEPDIARAETRVQEAQQAGAVRGGGGAELDAGEERLRKARDAAARGDDEEARRLARHAELDAALAEAKVRRQQAETAAAEMRAAIADLEAEAARPGPVAPTPTIAPVSPPPSGPVPGGTP